MAKRKGKKLGRRKGSKDKKQRRRSGYWLRHALERKQKDEVKGIHKELEDYVKNPPLNNEVENSTVGIPPGKIINDKHPIV